MERVPPEALFYNDESILFLASCSAKNRSHTRDPARILHEEPVRPKKQCAALTTVFALMRLPPQK